MAFLLNSNISKTNEKIYIYQYIPYILLKKTVVIIIGFYITIILADLILVVNSEEPKSKLNIRIEMIRLLLVNPKQRLAGKAAANFGRQTALAGWRLPWLAG